MPQDAVGFCKCRPTPISGIADGTLKTLKRLCWFRWGSDSFGFSYSSPVRRKLLDFMSDSSPHRLRPVFPARPQLRPSAASVPDRTLIARMSEKMPEDVRQNVRSDARKIVRRYDRQNVRQSECQETCKECHTECQKRCQKGCQKER